MLRFPYDSVRRIIIVGQQRHLVVAHYELRDWMGPVYCTRPKHSIALRFVLTALFYNLHKSLTTAVLVSLLPGANPPETLIPP